MSRTHVALGVVLLLGVVLAAAGEGPLGAEMTFKAKGGHAKRATLKDEGAAMPVLFSPNEGQYSSGEKFRAQSKGISVSFDDGSVEFNVVNRKGEHAKVSLGFKGSKNTAVAPWRRAVTKTHFMTGSSPVKSVASFEGVKYAGVFPKVDAYWKGVAGKVKSEFHVKPGGDVEDIVLVYTGAKKVHINSKGALVLKTEVGKLVDSVPFVYQHGLAGKKKAVEGGYRLIGDGEVGFWVGKYDKSKPLIIDPLVGWVSYLGGSFNEEAANRVVITSQGDYIVAGWTDSANMPVPKGGFMPKIVDDPSERGDAFIARISPDGYRVKAMTFLGGHGSDIAKSVAVDGNGDVWVVGSTTSKDFPVAGNALPHDNSTTTPGPGQICDAFIVKLSANLDKLEFGSRFGGSKCDYGSALAIDPLGAVYVTGQTESTDFPVSKTAIQKTHAGGKTDAFIARVSPGDGMSSSTYLGGPKDDEAVDIELVDQHVYLAGNTEGGFPIPGHIKANHEFHGGRWDGFIARADRFLSLLGSAQYIGGEAIDKVGALLASKVTGKVIVVGNTASVNLPTVRPIQPKFGGGSKDVFIDCMNLEMTTHDFVTYLGGAKEDTASDIAMDDAGNLYITGLTNSDDYPMKGNPVEKTRGEWEAYVTMVNANGTDIAVSFTYGSSRWTTGRAIDVTKDGRVVVVAGETRNAIMETTPNVFQGAFGGETDDFVAAFILHSECQNKCQHGVLEHVSCECHCVAPWQGPTCEQCDKTCPPNLWLDQGNCTCRECDCSGHGTCSKLTGDCRCGLAWAGPTCGEIICPGNCTGHGRCIDGRCDCAIGFYGERCSFKTCPKDCSGKGSCLDGTCSCKHPYYGADCSLVYTECPRNCSQNGECISVNGKMQCKCADGWTGADCSQRSFPCPGNCTSHGSCDILTGRCHCDIGWNGADCSTCNAWCGNGGVRDDKNCECSCPAPWEGPSCLYCPKTKCPNGGKLNKKTCRCDCEENKEGSCEEPAPSRDLNSHTGTGRHCDHHDKCEDHPTGSFSAVDRNCTRECIACNASHTANPFSRINSKNCVDFCGQMCHPICSKTGPTPKDLELCDGCVQGCVLHCPAVAKHRESVANAKEAQRIGNVDVAPEMNEAINHDKVAKDSLSKAVAMAQWKKRYIKSEIKHKERQMKKALDRMEQMELDNVDKVLQKHQVEILKNHNKGSVARPVGAPVDATMLLELDDDFRPVETVPAGSLETELDEEVKPDVVEDLSADLAASAGDAVADAADAGSEHNAEQSAPEKESATEPAVQAPVDTDKSSDGGVAGLDADSQIADQKGDDTSTALATGVTNKGVLEANREDAVKTGFSQLPKEEEQDAEQAATKGTFKEVAHVNGQQIDVKHLLHHDNFECAADQICDDVCTYAATPAIHSCVTGCAGLCVETRKCVLGGAGDTGCTGCTSQCVDGCLQKEPEASEDQ